MFTFWTFPISSMEIRQSHIIVQLQLNTKEATFTKHTLGSKLLARYPMDRVSGLSAFRKRALALALRTELLMWCNHTQKWCDDRFFPPHTLIRLNRFSRILPGSMMQVKWKEKRTQTRTNPQKPESLCCYLLLFVSVVDVLLGRGWKKWG